MVDPEELREALATVCTPVTVVTTRVGDRAHATTVSAFTALSLDPPLVLVSLDRASRLLAEIRASGTYGVNVLEHGQEELALAFAGRGAEALEETAWELDHDLPRLDGAGAWLACTVHELVEAGDHVVAIGAVRCAEHDAHRPLLYRRRAFGTLASVA